MGRPVRPSRVQVVNSIALIAICAWITSLMLAAILSPDRLFSILGPIFFIPVSILVGLLQYRATFRKDAASAQTVAVLMYCAGGFCIFASVVVVIEVLWESTLSDVFAVLATISVPSFAVGAYGLLCGWINWRWEKTLRQARLLSHQDAPEEADPAETENTDPEPLSRWQITAWEFFLAVTIIATVTALTTYYVRSMAPRLGEHLTREEVPFRLPEGASDVCYYRFGPNRAFEFTIDEAGFFAWVESGPGTLESEADNLPVEPFQ